MDARYASGIALLAVACAGCATAGQVGSPASCPGNARDVVAKSDSETMVARESRQRSEVP
jgi:hypothetical protein